MPEREVVGFPHDDVPYLKIGSGPLADIQDAEPIPRSAAIRMVKEPTGPTRTGTRWHEAVRVAPLCWLHVESVVSQVHQPDRLGMDFHSRWLIGHLNYDIEPAPDGSILHHRDTVRPRGLLRWLSPLVERRMRPRIIERLADIKQILEASSWVASAPLRTSLLEPEIGTSGKVQVRQAAE